MNPAYFLETAACHVQLALRTLMRRRGAYLHAIGTLALGIGIAVAMFSLVDAVLLRPLPFPRQEAVLVIWKTNPRTGVQVDELAYPELGDLQQNIRDFEYVAVMPTSLYGYAKVLQTGSAEPVQIESAPVSHDFFRVLGVAPTMGRDFATSDEHVGAAPVVIVSDRVWRAQLGADRNIIGRMIRLNSEGVTVIGVMAPGVEFPRGAGLWTPLGVEQRVVQSRGATFLQAIARMKPGRSGKIVARQVNALFKRLAADHPKFYSPFQQGVITPLVEYWAGSARLHLLIMLGASILMLVASTINSGNLLLSRTLARRTEIATRMALGAGPTQILLQVAAEGAAIALIATTGGLAIGQAAIRLVIRWAPADIPRLSDATLDLRAFCFAAGAAVFASVGCSVIAGWSATRMHLDSAIREGGTRLSLSRRSGRQQSMFILAQAAVAVVLLAVASLFLVSYRCLMSTDVGFANRDALTMNVSLRGPGLFATHAFDPDTRREFYTRLLSRLRESPGVTSAAAALLRPLEGTIGWDVPYELEFEAGEKDERTLPRANYEVITPGYFQTVGTPLLEGRDFNERDLKDGEAVVIISRTVAERIRAAGHPPLGYPVRLGLGPRRWSRAIGICADASYRSVAQKGMDIFVPSSQAQAATGYLVIRGNRPAQELSALVRRRLAELDSSQAVAGVATIGELIDANTAQLRFNMLLLLSFGICSVTLAAIGVYSVIAETVAAREREMAIKSALGAQRPRLVREVVSNTLKFVLIGEVLGISCTAIIGPLASDLLYHVSPRDPMILAWVGAFIFIVSVVAAFWPAWIASRGGANTLFRTT